ncbi:MAG: energy transducer TonB [bacterium]|nr:energy transducer TonB [bacterium]
MNRQKIMECILVIGILCVVAAALSFWRREAWLAVQSVLPAQRIDTEPPPTKIAVVDLPSPAAIRATPSSSPGGWLSDGDYPVEAMRNAWHGTAAFALVVTPSGTVENCLIMASSGHAVLDAATCRLLKQNAQFVPGRDMAGKPTTDSYRGRITWRLPE